MRNFLDSVRFLHRHAAECAGGDPRRRRQEPRAETLRRLVGRLQASLNYSSVDEILQGDVIAYLRGIQFQCGTIHNMIYELYIDYSIQAALAG